MENFYDDDLIKNYLDGALAPPQRKAIEKKIKEDPAYAQEIELQRSIIKSLKKNETAKLLTSAKDFHAQMEAEGFFKTVHEDLNKELTNEQPNASNATTSTVVSLFSKLKWLTAAAALILVVFLLLPSDDRPPLFANNFEQYPDKISEIISFELNKRLTTEEAKQAALKMQLEGMQQYNRQAYTKAIPLYEKCLADYPDYDKDGEVKFYLSIAYLANAQEKKALSLLEKINTEASEIPIADRNWYLALAYVYNQQKEQAKLLLNQLLEHENYGSKATLLLKEL